MTIPYSADLAGAYLFIISGALAASDQAGRRYYSDAFSVFFTGFVTAIGGGTLRDMVLGSYPVSWVKDLNVLIAIFAGFLTVLIFFRWITKLRRTLFLFDTLGIGLFTIVGLEKSLALGVNPLASAILGMFSAVFGGVIRDVLINEVPLIFRKEIYATACLAGAGLYLLLDHFGVEKSWCFIPSVVLIVVIRLAAVNWNWSLPPFGKKD